MRSKIAGLMLVAAALVTACTGPHDTATTTESPIITAYHEAFSVSWEPADDIGQISSMAESELTARGLSVLVPASLPTGMTEATGELRISVTIPTDLRYVDVVIRFVQDGDDGLISLESTPLRPDAMTCANRAAAGQSWEKVEVRASTGCITTNLAGITFLTWDDGVNVYHVETRMDRDELLAWLDDWVQIP
jgi:hypothetical protein